MLHVHTKQKLEEKMFRRNNNVKTASLISTFYEGSIRYTSNSSDFNKKESLYLVR